MARSPLTSPASSSLRQVERRLAPLVAGLLTAALAGCSGGAGADEPTADVRVDHSGENDVSEATAPRTCLSGGALHAVWQENRTGKPGIWFNTSSDGGKNWLTSDIAINHTPASAEAPDVACSGQDVYVVWEDERDGDLLNHNIYVSVSRDGGQEFAAEDVLLDADVDGAAMSLGPRAVAVGEDVYVAWFDNTDGAYDIRVQASHNSGRDWMNDAARADSDEAGSAYSAWPSIAATESSVVVAWEDSRGGANDIYASASLDGGESFDNDVRLDSGDASGATNSFEPRLAMRDDTAAVTWYDERNGARDVYVNVSMNAGASWLNLDEAPRVDGDGAGEANSLHPALALQGSKVYLTWQDDRSGGYDIYQRTYDTGTEGFGDEVRIDTDADGESQSYYPSIAVDGEHVFVNWQDYREDKDAVGFNDLYYNYSADGGTNWNQDDLRINSNEPGSSYAIHASAAIVGQSFVSVWSDGRNGTADLYSASRTLGAESIYVAPEKPKDEG